MMLCCAVSPRLVDGLERVRPPWIFSPFSGPAPAAVAAAESGVDADSRFPGSPHGIVALPAQSQTVCRLGLDELRMGRADRYRRQSETRAPLRVRRQQPGPASPSPGTPRVPAAPGAFRRSGSEARLPAIPGSAESGRRFFHHFREPPASNIHESVPVFHKGRLNERRITFCSTAILPGTSLNGQLTGGE